MQVLAFALNFSWSIILLVVSIVSGPKSISVHREPFAIIILVRSFWYYRWVPAQKGVRAMTLGNVILLGPSLLTKDLEHELVHVKQHLREPLIHPVLNFVETVRHGYRKNKYEEEAYSTTESTYMGKKLKPL